LTLFKQSVYNRFMISCVLLSAGSSSRFGSPKALATIKKTTVIDHILNTLSNTNIYETIVVLGSHAELIKPLVLKHKKARFVYNKDYNFGQTSSFKVGMSNISGESTGVLLLPVDYPFVAKETIDALIDQFSADGKGIIIPSYEGKKGHPPIIDVKVKDEILSLENNTGINVLFHQHQDQLKVLPLDDPGVIQTFNTKEEFEKLTDG